MAKKSAKSGALIPSERIEQAILLIRGQKVMLDADLAALYGVETKVLNQAVKRNLDRFPEDFMFQLTWEETKMLHSLSADSSPAEHESSRSQTVTLKRGQNPKYRRYAFTEQGVAMLSSVLKSPRAVAVNIEIMRTFVRLRQILATHAELARRLDELEKKYDRQFAVVFDAIRQLMTPPTPERREMGYHTLVKPNQGSQDAD